MYEADAANKNIKFLSVSTKLMLLGNLLSLVAEIFCQNSCKSHVSFLWQVLYTTASFFLDQGKKSSLEQLPQQEDKR